MLRAFQTASARTAAKAIDHRRIFFIEKIKGALSALLQPFFSFIAMFLLMRAEALNEISPMAPAFLAASLASGRHPAALCAGCMAGMIRIPIGQSALIPAIACAITLGGELAFSLMRVRRLSPENRCALMGGVAVMLPSLVFAGGELFASLQAIAAGAVAAAAAPFFKYALGIDKKRSRLLPQEKTGALLLLASVSGGAYALHPALSAIIATFSALALHFMGAAAGIICGMGCALGGAGIAFVAPAAVTGFAAGWKFLRSRRQRSLCAAAVSLLLYFTGALSLAALSGSLLAALAYALIPRKLADAALVYARPEEADPKRMAREICEDSRARLTALAEAFGEMAQSCAQIEEMPDEQALISEMRSRLCSGCAEYPACWNGGDNHAVHFLCALIGEALKRVDAPAGMRVIYSDGEIPPDIMRFCRRGRMIPDRLGLLLRDFAEKRRSVIKRSMTNRSLHRQYAQARELIFALAERQAAPAQLRDDMPQRLEAAMERAGISSCEVCAYNARALEIRLARTRGEWTNEDVARASRAFAQSFGGGFTLHRRENTLCFTQRPRFEAQTGVSCCAGKAGEICGDSHLLRMLNPSRLAVMLSDGMGSGENAARESAAALKMLWRFLYAGISRPLAIETVNQHMLMRTGDEIYATVDLAIIDLNTGAAEFSKLAACRTLILRSSEIISVEAGNLPLGILENVQPELRTVKLRHGDTIVIASDGVMDACDAPAMNRFLRAHASDAPDVIADALVREAALCRDPRRSDDMTCICVRITEASGRRKNRAAAR